MDSSSQLHRHKQPAPWKQIVDEETLNTQRSLRSSQGPKDEELKAFEKSLSPFQLKFHELEALKKTSLNVMAKFNNLQIEYTDWFKRQLKTFVELLKSVQISQRHLAPQRIETLRDFHQLHQIALNMSTNSKLMPQFDKFDKFLSFWKRFNEIKAEMECSVMKPLQQFCDSVASLRQPEVKRQIDYLYSTLNYSCNEEFKLDACHNEKDNLYTYSLMTSDNDFLGLVGFVPFLIGYASKICYLATNIHLEKLH